MGGSRWSPVSLLNNRRITWPKVWPGSCLKTTASLFKDGDSHGWSTKSHITYYIQLLSATCLHLSFRVFSSDEESKEKRVAASYHQPVQSSCGSTSTFPSVFVTGQALSIIMSASESADKIFILKLKSSSWNCIKLQALAGHALSSFF